MSQWAKGSGRYVGGGMYVVEQDGVRVATFMYHQHVGRRRIGRRPDNVLVIPKDASWPERVLTQGLTGLWEIGDDLGQVFATELPEGGTLYDPSAPIVAEFDSRPTEEVVGDALQLLTEQYAIVKGPRRAVWFTTTIAGLRYVFAYEPTATVGTAGHIAEVLRRLDEKAMKVLVTRLRGQAVSEATPMPYHDGLLRDNIHLNGNSDTWVWGAAEDEQPVCPYGQAAVIDLRTLIPGGMAIQLGLNRVEGEPLEVVGFLARSEVAYSGVNGDPLKLLVPCPPSVQRSVCVVVKHSVGYGVWGFTVVRRFDELEGRVVHFAPRHLRMYFTDPGTQEAFAMPGIG